MNEVVRFGKVDKTYIKRNSFLPRQLLQPTNHKHHIGGRTVRSETSLFLRQDPHALAVFAEVASDDLQQYLAGVRYYNSEMPLYLPHSVRLFFLWSTMMMALLYCCGTLVLLEIGTAILSSLRRRAGSPLRVTLNSSTETPFGPAAFSFANERMASISSCIVG